VYCKKVASLQVYVFLQVAVLVMHRMHLTLVSIYCFNRLKVKNEPTNGKIDMKTVFFLCIHKLNKKPENYVS